jgi:hypothetical protein
MTIGVESRHLGEVVAVAAAQKSFADRRALLFTSYVRGPRARVAYGGRARIVCSARCGTGHRQ